MFETILSGCLLGYFANIALFRNFPRLWYVLKFPAHLLHELSHFLVALVLLARPGLPSFALEEKGNVLVMGRVRCRNLNAFNAFPGVR